VTASKTLLICWLGLVLLSVGTVALGNLGASLALAGGMLAVALGKAWLITDGFMELRHAPLFWRVLLFGWPLAMAGGVWLTLL
jgi:hypothetical protein